MYIYIYSYIYIYIYISLYTQGLGNRARPTDSAPPPGDPGAKIFTRAVCHTGHEALGKLTGFFFENSYFQCGLCIGGSCCSKRTDVTEIGNTRQLGTPCDTNIQQDMIQKACLCRGFHSISYSTCIRVNN